jgi:anaerobic magnesium-protoporphyrin IX monomethyl ester cyclase
LTDLVIVNPNARIPAPNAAIEPPLWAGLIAGYNLSKLKSVSIIDAEAEDLSVGDTVRRVKDLNPKEVLIVVMGTNPSVSSTPKMPVTLDLLKCLPNAKLTGIHPIALNCPNTVVKPFDGLPTVPWYLLPRELYKAHNWHCLQDIEHRSPYAVLYTSLNCPYSCSYCNIHTLYGDHKIKYRYLEDIYQELIDLSWYGVRHIKIWDELFCLDEHRVNKICDFIISLNYEFNFWAYARVDTVTEKMLSKMKKAGINWLSYGFESASENIRQKSNKKFDESKVRRAIDMTRNAGINIMGNFTFGLPGDNLDSMKTNLEMAIRENFEYVNFYVALPYPGSAWYESLKDKPTDWSRFGQYSKDMYGDPEVIKFKDQAFQTYFRRPEYLSMIKGKFGDKAEDHIKELVKWNIRK